MGLPLKIFWGSKQFTWVKLFIEEFSVGEASFPWRDKESFPALFEKHPENKITKTSFLN
jgi:hypothetical protein